MARGEADAAIVIDGAGLGSTIAANKVAGARAAMCLNETLARYAREHNGANVLALGSTLVTTEQALAIVDTFLDTPMREARYIRRLAKIRELETGGPKLNGSADVQRLVQIIVEELAAAAQRRRSGAAATRCSTSAARIGCAGSSRRERRAWAARGGGAAGGLHR